MTLSLSSFVVRSYPYFYFGTFAILTLILAPRDEKGEAKFDVLMFLVSHQ